MGIFAPDGKLAGFLNVSWESDRIEYIDVDLFHPYLYIWSIHDCVIYNGHANGTKRRWKDYFRIFQSI